MQDKIAVYGIVFRKGHDKRPDKELGEVLPEVLLVKRRDIPVWTLPGGGCDPGETPRDGAVREVAEETGYVVSVVREVAEYSPVNRMTQLTHTFECVVMGGEAVGGAETREVRFFPVDKLPDMPPPFAAWIRDALSCETEVIRKPVEGVTYGKLLQLLVRHPQLVLRYLLTKVGIHLNS